MEITMPKDTIEVISHLVEVGFYSPIDIVSYPEMGFVFVDCSAWEVGFALWHQSMLACLHARQVYPWFPAR